MGTTSKLPSPRRDERAAIDPPLLFAISLLMSLALWWPSLRQALSGNLDITVAGLHYLAALGLSWLAVFGVGTLVSGYAQTTHHAQPSPPALPPTPIVHPLRRDDDTEVDPSAVEEPAA
ncbi:MAG: hypothetical protein JWL83_2222 [Actinomycetia bacterium]|nr:hypothetical protein [Actinomycetes bacterium]